MNINEAIELEVAKKCGNLRKEIIYWKEKHKQANTSAIVFSFLWMISVVALVLCSSKACADGFYIEGQAVKNLDTASDYWQWSPEGYVPMQGMAMLSVGYSLDVTKYTELSFGVAHYSNPFTSYDYGGNGVFIKFCIGKGC